MLALIKLGDEYRYLMQSDSRGRRAVGAGRGPARNEVLKAFNSPRLAPDGLMSLPMTPFAYHGRRTTKVLQYFQLRLGWLFKSFTFISNNCSRL